jgi:hypothetical protein
MAHHPVHGARGEVGQAESLNAGIMMRRYTRRA